MDRQTKGKTEGQIDGWTDELTVSELRNYIPFWQHLCAAMKSATQIDMNKPENCLNSLDPSLITFTTHNFYSPKIICISFPILEKEKTNINCLLSLTTYSMYM